MSESYCSYSRTQADIVDGGWKIDLSKLLYTENNWFLNCLFSGHSFRQYIFKIVL